MTQLTDPRFGYVFIYVERIDELDKHPIVVYRHPNDIDIAVPLTEHRHDITSDKLKCDNRYRKLCVGGFFVVHNVKNFAGHWVWDQALQFPDRKMWKKAYHLYDGARKGGMDAEDALYTALKGSGMEDYITEEKHKRALLKTLFTYGDER